MTDKITEARRAGFEVHMMFQHQGTLDFDLNSDGSYWANHMQDRWEIWNAALDSVVVELPASMDMPEEDDCDGYEEYEAMEAVTCTANGMRHACRNAIHAAGVRTR